VKGALCTLFDLVAGVFFALLHRTAASLKCGYYRRVSNFFFPRNGLRSPPFFFLVFFALSPLLVRSGIWCKTFFDLFETLTRRDLPLLSDLYPPPPFSRLVPSSFFSSPRVGRWPGVPLRNFPSLLIRIVKRLPQLPSS